MKELRGQTRAREAVPVAGSKPLAGLRVLEFSSSFGAVRQAGAELLSLGADVILLEPPGGDPVRGVEPTVAGVGLAFALASAGKHCIELSTWGEAIVDETTELVTNADIILMGEDLGREAALQFGQSAVVGLVSGTKDKREGAPTRGEITAQAATGYMAYLGARNETPRRLVSDLGEFIAGLLLLQGVLSLVAVHSQGEVVEVSLVSALSTLKSIIWAARTDPDEWEGLHLNGATRAPDRGWRTKDGVVTLDFRTATKTGWEQFAEALHIREELASAGADAVWEDTLGNGDHVPEYRSIYEPALRKLRSEQIRELVITAGGMSEPYLSYSDVVDHPQVIAEHGIASDVLIGETPVRRVSPIGHLAVVPQPPSTDQPEHLSVQPPKTFIRNGATRPWKTPSNWRPPRQLQGRSTPPLADVRVLEFTHAGVGPFCGMLLGRLGANVVKVEQPTGDMILKVLPTSGGECTTYAVLNLGKRAIRLDLRQDADRIIAQQLASQADVIIENLRVGALGKFELDYQAIKTTNANVVYLSLTGFGLNGPLATARCTDPQMQAFSGLAFGNGRGNPELFRYLAAMDLSTGTAGAYLVCAALAARSRTGEGQYLSTSMLRVALSMQSRAVGEHLLGIGQVDPPGLVLRCLDGWIAIDSELQSFAELCHALGADQLSDDPRFSSALLRRRVSAELGQELERSTSTRPLTWWLGRLHRVRIPAAQVLDDELASRGAELLMNSAFERIPTAWASHIDASTSPWSFYDVPLGPPPTAPRGSQHDDSLFAALRQNVSWPA